MSVTQQAPVREGIQENRNTSTNLNNTADLVVIPSVSTQIVSDSTPLSIGLQESDAKNIGKIQSDVNGVSINNIGESQNEQESNVHKSNRFDRFGIPIIKVNRRELMESPTRNKKERKEDKKKLYKVSFLDKIENPEPLMRTHYVLSFKKFNAMNTFDPTETEGS